MRPTILSIQVGLPMHRGRENAADPHDRPWFSAFFKQPIAGPVRVGKTSIAGDGQADLENHGGVDKAILAYSGDHYPYWRELLEKADMPHGAFGENLTIAGIGESTVCIGDVWSIGDVQLEVSQPRQPCWKLGRRWRLADLPNQVIANGKSGWYFRVLHEGIIEAGQGISLVNRPNPNWTIAAANNLMFHCKEDRNAAAQLAALPELSKSWQMVMNARAGMNL